MLRSNQNKIQQPQQVLTRRVSSTNGYDTKSATTLPHVMGLPFKTFLVVLFMFVIVIIFGTVNILLINLQPNNPNHNADANLHSHDFNSFMRGGGSSSLRRIGFGMSSSTSIENEKLKKQLQKVTDERDALKKQQTNDDKNNDDGYFHNPEYLSATHMSQNDPNHYFYANSSNFITFPFVPDRDQGSNSFFLWIYLRHPLEPVKKQKRKRTIITTKSSSCGETTTTSHGYRFYMDEDDDDTTSLVLELSLPHQQSAAACRKIASPINMSPNQWVHVGFTLGPTDGVRLYFNGESLTHHPPSNNFDLAKRLVTTDRHSGDAMAIGRGLLVRGSGEHEEVVAEALEGYVALMGYSDYLLREEDMRQIYEKSEVELVGFLTRSQLAHRDATLVLYTCRGLHNDKVTFELPEIMHGVPGRIHQNYTEHLRFTPPSFTSPGGKTHYAYHNGSHSPIITPTMTEESDELSRSTRRPAIRAAMKHAWSGYRKYAWGKDEIRPLSKDGIDRWRGMAMTLVDALDTLWLMDMKTEFNEARDWIRDNMDFDQVGEVSVFETTIRHLGGLLAAYDWSRDEVFLQKAEDLGERLLVAFNSPSGFPYNNVVLSSKLVKKSISTVLSEVGTLQMEFRHLAHLTGKPVYAEKVDRIFQELHASETSTGLYPVLLGVQKRRVMVPKQGRVSFGALGDSFYEYLLKTWIQGGKKEDYLREMYDKAIDGMHEYLVQTSVPSGFTYVAEMTLPDVQEYKMDHLVCFLGGTLALGAYTDPRGLESERAQRDLATAKALTYTCYQMYTRTHSGLSPELVRFKDGADMVVPQHARHYLLRPETVESFYYLHHLTGDPVYREWGWNVFQAIEANCKTEVGYGAYMNVMIKKMVPKDEMESFFLAETLKYLYLLFDPDSEVDILNKHVFNTEAHPLTRLDLQLKNEQQTRD